MISVIIPVRNVEKTIRESINSVLDQRIENMEIICIVNGCTDNTEKVIKETYRLEKRLSVIQSSPGIVSALNAGLRASKGDIIARQDGDDVWLRGKLDKQINFLEKNKDIQIVGTQMEIADEFMNSFDCTDYPTTHNEIVGNLLAGHNSIGHPSVVFRREILDKCAGYLDLFPLAEDMDLWLRSAAWYKLSNIKEAYVKYRQKHNPAYDPRIPQALSSWYRSIYGVESNDNIF